MKFDYYSKSGVMLSLTNGQNYKLVNIDSQTSATSNISSIVIGGVDGDTVNNIQAQPRTIVLDLRITADVEKTKRNILNVIKLKQQGTIRWEQDNKVVEITGIVESIDMPRWSKAVTMQITLHCEQPFWEDIDNIISDINEAIDLHYFTSHTNDMLYFPEAGIALGEYDVTRTRVIHNTGDVSVGLDIEIIAYDTATNPIIHAASGKFFGCGYGTGNKKVTMSAGDVIKISTGKNEKAVTLNGTSILGKVKPNSAWLQLEAGDNTFSINSDEETVTNMSFSLTYKRRYV